MRLVRFLGSVAPGLVVAAATIGLQAQPALAYVALMDGQRARPLNGTFNRVPVLHSNQPEEVEGPGILIDTSPGHSYATENSQPLRNAEFTFNGEFGMHLHHKYFPPYRAQISPNDRRTELTLAAILINPGNRPVHIRFDTGAVRNSFEAPYLANNLMGAKPLGRRPWNTGPGDATAVLMLRGQLDRRLANEITIPARSRLVLFRTQLPALGIANALLRGRSDGPFQVAVVAASNPQSDADIVRVLDQRRLAPGRVYLDRVGEIQNRRIFSRVGGVALGDTYQASITHDLGRQGPLHVPLTSTERHHFGTGDIQVNALAARMADSALDNVGTYGVRFDVDLNLTGNGPYELVMSHPNLIGRPDFTAFRGSIQIRTSDGVQEVHLGMRSGQSHAIAQMNLRPGGVNPVRVSLVYPADATPGHLLSVVPTSQLAMVQERERQREIARAAAEAVAKPAAPPVAPRQPPAAARRQATPTPAPPPAPRQQPAAIRPAPQPLSPPGWMFTTPPPPPQLPGAGSATDPDASLVERYRRAVNAQQERLRNLDNR